MMRDEPLEDWEEPDPDEGDDEDDSSDTYFCPECGATVYEDCERCPECGDYITPQSRSTFAPGRRWIVVVAVALIVMMLGLMLLGHF